MRLDDSPCKHGRSKLAICDECDAEYVVETAHEDALADEEEMATWDGLLHLFRLTSNQQISARKARELAKEVYYGRVTMDQLPPLESGPPLTGDGADAMLAEREK